MHVAKSITWYNLNKHDDPYHIDKVSSSKDLGVWSGQIEGQ